MDRPSLIEAARLARELTQETVARRAGTSQPTLSAYERGTRSPTLTVAERILHTLDFELGLYPRVAFRHVHLGRRADVVPDQLWRLDPGDCFVAFTVGRGASEQTFNPRDHRSRVAGYAWLILHAEEALMLRRLDGALLADAWPDIAPHLPEELHEAWQSLVDRVLEGWWIDQLGAGRPRPPKPVSARATKRAVRRLSELGLTHEEILAVLEKRHR